MIPMWNYVLYLGISIALTVWVARTLHRNGRIFLVECFGNNEKLADSVNHLLVVGFYLVNIGFVTLALRSGDKPATPVEAMESLSTKVGLVLLVLGVLHFMNLAGFSKLHRRAMDRTRQDEAALTTAIPVAKPRHDGATDFNEPVPADHS